MIGIELKHCPKCGGKGEIKDCKVFLDDGVRVTCSGCNYSTQIVLIDCPKITAKGLDEKTRYSKAQAIQRAAEMWNGNTAVDKNGDPIEACPFCGGQAIAEICYAVKEFRIYCVNCPGTMRISFADAGLDDGTYISFAEATAVMKELVENWNRRNQ